jgi:hypothetical protein
MFLVEYVLFWKAMGLLFYYYLLFFCDPESRRKKGVKICEMMHLLAHR